MSAPKVVRSRFRRWRRKLGFLLLGTCFSLAGAGVAAWIWRVPLLNRVLAFRSSVWKIQLESADPTSNGLRVTGLRVSHVDQTEAVFSAAAVETTSGWQDLQRGKLGKLTVEAPALYWRAGLSADPPDPGFVSKVSKEKLPLVSWEALQITGGRIDVADPGSFVFKSGVAGKGGAGAWFPEGRLGLSPQDLTLTFPLYTMSLADGPVRSIAVQASQLDLQASLDSATGILAVPKSHFTSTRIKLSGSPNEDSVSLPPPAMPVIEAPDNPGSDPGRPLISGVRLDALTAPSMQCEATLPWGLSTSGDFTLAQLVAGSGVPFAMAGIRYAKASAALPGETRIAQYDLAASRQNGLLRADSFTFSGADIHDLSALLATFGVTGLPAAAVSFSAEGRLKDLPLSAAWTACAAVQQISLRNFKLASPEWGTLAFDTASIEGVPEEIASAQRFRRFGLDSPVADLRLSPNDWTGTIPQTGMPTVASNPDRQDTSRPLWEGWSADTLTIKDGNFAATLSQVDDARVTSRFGLDTVTPGDGEVAPLYRLGLEQPQLTHPQFPGPPIALAGTIQLTASTSGLWQKRELEDLQISGTRLQINDALFRLFKSQPDDPPPLFPADITTPALAQLKSPPWRLKLLVLDQSLIQIDNLGGRSRLDVPIKRQEFHDLPLDSSALAAVDRVYKIEVPNVTFYSPFNAGQKVATLDTNYIQFTPSGLFKRKLERVDIMAPVLYAGQPLFDFVDAARKRFADLAAAPSAIASPLLAEVAPRSPTMLSALASITPSMAASTEEWDIPFYMESGKVLIAPKGFPWPGLPEFPFRNARDAAGKPVPFQLHGETFHGELAIEPRWYDFPEYKVRLRLSERGRIIFNTPQKDRDNNLTEVFENNTLIFRQLEIDKAWLSVTYDARGIYARFGGLTCGGTLNGGLNLYLDELYTWDAWASLTGIDMKPLTDKLTPDTFRMTGPVDELTIKAFGDTTTLYQASVDLKVTRPGHLHLLALDALQDRIKALGGLSADFGKISVETLRDFAYTGCKGSLKLFGSEGSGQLQLTGPAGSRTLNLRLLDYRAKTPKSAAPF